MAIDLEQLAKECADRASPSLIPARGLTAADAAGLATILETKIIVARVLDGKKLRGKNDLLAALAQAFSFPGHFGHNWDALLDCLSDFSWLPAQGYVCIVLHQNALKKADFAAYDGFLDVCVEAAQRWKERPAGFFKMVGG